MRPHPPAAPRHLPSHLRALLWRAASAASAALLVCAALLAHSPAARAQDVPRLRLCAGPSSGHYYGVGQMIARAMQGVAFVELVETKGSWENLGRAHATPPQCDALIAQDDAYEIYLYENPSRLGELERVTALYSEHVHLLCNRQARARSLSTLPPSTGLVIGPYGSGTYITWQLITRLNPQAYRPIRAIEASAEEGLLRLADGAQAQCMLSVSALAQGAVARANDDYGLRLELVPVMDPSFQREVKGRVLYRPSYIHKNVYPQLTTDHLLTQSVDAVFFLQSGWRKAFPVAAEQLLRALGQLQPSIQRVVD